MSAAMASEQPAPRFRWYRGERSDRFVADGAIWTAEEASEFLRGSNSGAVVTVVRRDCVRVEKPGFRAVLFHGEFPSLSLPPGSEADARRALIRINDTLQRCLATAKERADAPGADVADRVAYAVQKIDADLVARELADLNPLRSETAVGATT